MSLNEKLKDLNYVDRDEWFEVIKDVCRSQSKRAVGFLAVILLLFILAGIYFFTSNYQGGHEVGDIAAICFELVICFALIWGIVNHLKFLWMAKNIKTPQQLLHQHEKRMKNDRRASLVCIVALVVSLGGPYAFTDRDLPSFWTYWAMKAILIVFILIFYFKGSYLRPSNRDNEISERLQELIDPE